MKKRLSDEELIDEFIHTSIQNREVLLANLALSAQSTTGQNYCVLNQLLSKTEGLVASSQLDHDYPEFLVRHQSPWWCELNYALARHNFITIEKQSSQQFASYQYVKVPTGYRMTCTKAMVLWRTWWKYYRTIRHGSQLALNLLVRVRQTWYPIRNLEASNGLLYITTLVDETTLHGEDLICWLEKEAQS